MLLHYFIVLVVQLIPNQPLPPHMHIATDTLQGYYVGYNEKTQKSQFSVF